MLKWMCVTATNGGALNNTINQLFKSGVYCLNNKHITETYNKKTLMKDCL